MTAPPLDGARAVDEPIAGAEACDRCSDEIGLERREPHQSAYPGAAWAERKQNQGSMQLDDVAIAAITLPMAERRAPALDLAAA